MPYTSATNSPFTCDILIIGGGVAGVAAACGASFAGHSVILAERYGFLGGLAASAWVGTICGAYLAKDGKPELAVGKFPAAFVESVRTFTGAEPVRHTHDLIFLPATPYAISSVSSRFLNAAKIKVLTHMTLFDISLKNSSIDCARLLMYSEPVLIKPKAVIDTTGEALVSSLAGLGCSAIQESQAASLSLVIEGISGAPEEAALAREIALVVMRADLGCWVSVLPGSLRNNSAVLKINAGVTPRTPDEVIELEKNLREKGEHITELLAQSMPALKNIRIAHLTPQLGIRAGKIPQARNTLTGSHVLEGRSCRDGIALGCWPAERWMPDGSVSLKPIENSGIYQIPAGSLRSSACENLWFAGRSFGANEEALASARVIGSALGTGYAAGYLAASTVLGVPEEESVVRLRVEQGIT